MRAGSAAHCPPQPRPSPWHPPSAVRNFTIALAFHQLLEGIGLGSFIAIASFSMLKGEPRLKQALLHEHCFPYRCALAELLLHSLPALQAC